MRKVFISQRRLAQYRVPLFDHLLSLLLKENIDLSIVAGEGTLTEKNKRDAGHLAWVESIPTYYYASDRFCWQPLYRYLDDVDLLVMTQENKLLVNHLLLLAPRRFKLAFWGHGANLQSDRPDGLKERFKRWTTNRVDWWFAYTRMSAQLVEQAGFPDSRITVLHNSVDTQSLQLLRLEVTPYDTQALRKSLGFGTGPVGVYLGSLYTEKRLDFLFETAGLIRQALPDFHLLIIGDGPERDKVRAWCSSNGWAQWVGARQGREKVAYFSMAQVMLNPGAVGLGILDSFVCRTPMLTTDCRLHGPEIAYLENGVNGWMTANEIESYVDICVRLLSDEQVLEHLRRGCDACAVEYTVENMAQRFADGIVNCLDTPRYRQRTNE
ncbi:glycosyl transferase group 1 [Thiorhodococcus drewsii AZ1]|uniref:Glycosyl transferase group 1 n=1 Tax=Thiorhodococcus drewsii AZ1 TaxID=765913 RepID=G2E8B5_9GAMM|nr:glycosyltransferase family 4 protein [Thiorhodococcus drewsii]EGV27654.1 glycosyl transferase group 1 [Thiorhodococcus drewsii AZ1]